MINFFVQMKLNKFAYLYSKLIGNHTLKIMKKIPGNLLKNLEKSWKYQPEKVGTLSGHPGGEVAQEECVMETGPGYQ